MTAWMANSDLNSKPGILQQSLEVLKRKNAEKEANNEKLIGGLLWDEMSIKSALRWTENTMYGFEDVPNMSANERKDARIATEVILFMFTGINDDIKIPVAYYFTAPTDAETRYALAQKILKEVIDCGVMLTSITFDGHSSNPGVCEKMGANLNVFTSDFNPSFNVGNSKIHIILDPSHMLKMMRGAIGNRKILYNSENKPIKWLFFERLVNFRDRRNFSGMHKMAQAHIDFHTNAMKVILAVQTLSDSTANAMQFLMNQGYSTFENAQPTIEYIKMCSDIFSIFNSTKCSDQKENPLRNMMSRKNAAEIFQCFEKVEKYMKGLQIRTPAGNLVPICTSQLKTAFKGCVMNIRSYKNLYNELVLGNALTHIPTHSLSQDHLEVSCSCL